MFLVAVSKKGGGVATFEAPASGSFTLGMLPDPSGGAGFATGTMCRLISRLHSVAKVEGDMLVVERQASGRHRFVHPDTGEELPDRLALYPGDRFQIHDKGGVVFQWLRDPSELDLLVDEGKGTVDENERAESDSDAAQKGGEGAMTAAAELSDSQVREALSVLQHDLPLALTAWAQPRDLYVRVARFLARKVPGHRLLKVRFLALSGDGVAGGPARELSGDDGLAGDFTVRQKFLDELATSGDLVNGQPRVDSRSESGPESGSWALVLPLGVATSATAGGDEAFVACRDAGDRVVLYVEADEPNAGPGPEAALPFVKLLVTLTSQLVLARADQIRSERLGGFLSRRVRAIAGRGDLSALEPVNRECTVLFCDRWGSSKAAETGEESGQARLARLTENRHLLDLMARAVEASDGTVADFAGDGLLAFWGWPDGPGAEAHAWAAVEAAVWLITRVAADAREQAGGEVDFSRGFPVRIGINSGQVAVGQIGPPSQLKIGVFGDVVNVSARLEGLGKEFRVPVLLSAATVDALKNVPPPRPELADLLTRRLCRMVPKGMTRACDIHELVLGRELGGTGIDRVHRDTYEQALIAFEERRWRECLLAFDDLRTAGDPAAQMIRRLAEDYERGNEVLPENWRGEVSAKEK